MGDAQPGFLLSEGKHKVMERNQLNALKNNIAEPLCAIWTSACLMVDKSDRSQINVK